MCTKIDMKYIGNISVAMKFNPFDFIASIDIYGNET
jgi:hypothetical protein